MKQLSSLTLGLGLATVLLTGAAHAQLFYSPPPPLMGQDSYHLYSVPGVTGSAGMETFFACTNTTSANIRVGVEIFGSAGGAAYNDPSASSLDIGPGAGALFATTASVWITVDSVLSGPMKGSARILATERSGIICSAYIADTFNAPPTSMADLKVVKKAKQKGE